MLKRTMAAGMRAILEDSKVMREHLGNRAIVVPRISWWNPNYWMLPADGVTFASIFSGFGSFVWFWRNEINRHLFRVPVPAWQLGCAVSFAGLLMWIRLSRLIRSPLAIPIIPMDAVPLLPGRQWLPERVR